MHELTFIELMKISLVMPVLLVMSVVMFAVFLERLVFFTGNAQINSKLFKQIKDVVLAGNIKDARILAASGKGLLSQAFEALLGTAELGKSRVEMDHVISLYYQRTQALLGRRLGLFGTLSFISPLLGLLGTVLGVMTAFRDLALSGSGGPTVVAAGISEALVATAAGIGVAVTAALMYNYFNFKVKHILNSLNIFGQEIILMVETKKDI
jgi:biopolymer transport protein ExbB